mgnify:CR=1 FL=1
MSEICTYQIISCFEKLRMKEVSNEGLGVEECADDKANDKKFTCHCHSNFFIQLEI